MVNAYVLTFGGFMLLGGRLGDLYGHRRLFVGGVALFTAASVVCGCAQTQELLVVARVVQGVAGAVVSAVALSLIMTLFDSPADPGLRLRRDRQFAGRNSRVVRSGAR